MGTTEDSNKRERNDDDEDDEDLNVARKGEPESEKQPEKVGGLKTVVEMKLEVKYIVMKN